MPSRAELERRFFLERYFFLDDADREAVQAKRRANNRLGAEYLAEQLEIADASCLKLYGERDSTARTHAGEIQEAGGRRDFAEVRDELVVWPDARAWTTGDGPKALFDAAAGWLRSRSRTGCGAVRYGCRVRR